MTASTFLRDDATFAALIAGDVPDLSATYVVIPTVWSTYSPTITAFAGTLTTTVVNSARWKQIGKLIFVEVDVSITNNGTGSGAIRISSPATSFSANYPLNGFEAATGKGLAGFIGPSGSGTTSSFIVVFYDGTYPGGSGSNRIIMGITYEAA